MVERRPIYQKQRSVMDYIKATWYFDKWYEKLILTLLSALGVWKLFGFLF